MGGPDEDWISRCPWPKKHRHRDESEAWISARETVGLQLRVDSSPLVAYPCPAGHWHVGRERPTELRVLTGPVNNPEDQRWVRTRCWWCWRPLMVGVHKNDTPSEFVYCCIFHRREATAWRRYRDASEREVSCGWCGERFKPRTPEQAYCKPTHKRRAEEKRTKLRRIAPVSATGASPVALV